MREVKYLRERLDRESSEEITISDGIESLVVSIAIAV